jgi:hypothetical protein
MKNMMRINRRGLGGLAFLATLAGMMPASLAVTAAETRQWTLATDDTELRIAVVDGWPTVQRLGMPGEPERRGPKGYRVARHRKGIRIAKD